MLPKRGGPIKHGYQIKEMVLEKKEGDVEHYRITDWKPIEISIVSIPADPSVGIDRAAERSNEQTFKTKILY